MRALAELVMRGRRYAIGASMVGASIPLLNWLSTAIVGLVVLRKGAAEGSIVLLWALLPLGIAVYFVGDPMPVIALVGTAIMAYILRVTLSWELAIAVAVIASAIGSLVFEYTAADLLVMLVEFYVELSKQNSIEVSSEVARTAIVGIYARGQACGMCALLVLARWWQSQLYNPGGFQKEFHQIRLTPWFSTGVVVAMIFSFVFDDQLGRWLPLLTVPLVFSGIALVHWTFGFRKMSVNWVIAFYLLLIILSNLIYPILASLALMDSYLNLRQRIQTKKV
jgi:hypothetical protein